MVIVAGSFEVDPDQRDEYVASRREAMKESRSDAGCLEYVLAADPVEPGRVILFERWEDQASLDAHLVRVRGAAASQAGASQAGGVAPTSGGYLAYDIGEGRTL